MPLLVVGRRLPRDFKAGAAGQGFNRIDKPEALVSHNKTDRVAGGTTAKAVIELFVGADGERGGFFLVKRAAGTVVFARFAQFYVVIHHFDDVEAVQQIVDKRLRNEIHG